VNREQISKLRERLAASRLELVADIEERQAALDNDHDAILDATRQAPPLVFKTTKKNGPSSNGNGSNGTGNGGTIGDAGDADAPFNDEQTDALAAALAQHRAELAGMIDDATSPLRERIVAIEAKVDTLLAILGAGGNGAARSLGGSRRRAPRLLPPTQ
jgi:hypothetical protein